ncbi:MarR family winged helix-turn-helix transcriptional regulator [Ktedonosporobacter rubrisoli]|uniref:MarR family winged helix-turn-helix transcriptional regulator n=1 Tax=Ktedonosporobacter rubrisoli TaxID=2509675 RepID=UPI0013EE55E3|nr:MarR family winged helix-turn-helix transcriptional regulator [Ktedonosporobacter rubrisoli]
MYILLNMENETQPEITLALARVDASCLCLNARKMARALTHTYEAFMQPSGLRITQFSLLVAIALAQKVPLTHLAAILAMDRTTLARNLKLLESQNLVNVATSEKDRRVRLITLTQQGYRILKEVLPLWQEAQTQMISLLGLEQARALLANVELVMERVPFSS